MFEVPVKARRLDMLVATGRLKYDAAAILGVRHRREEGHPALGEHLAFTPQRLSSDAHPRALQAA